MQIVSNKYKEYLNKSLSISPKSKIVVDDIEYLGDVIKTSPKFSHSNSTFIGGFPAKTVSFDIYNLNNDSDFINKEIKVYKGITIDGIVEWVMQGIFIAQSKDITNNISTKTISISKAQDKTQLFDTKYESVLNWENGQTHTGLEIVQEVCTKLGITLETTNFSWANYNFKQPNFVEDITYREVISRIAQIGGEIAFINNSGSLVIKKQTVTGDKIQRKRYKNLSKEKLHTVNTVVLGKKGMNDDIKYPETIATDRVEYKINDNPFVDLYRKEMISTVAEYIIDKSYTPFTLEDFVDGFIYELNDVVTIIDKNGEEFDAVILDYSNSSRIKSNIKAETPDKNNTDYKLAGSSKEEIRKVKLDVDHVNQKIEALVSDVNESSEKINQLEMTSESTVSRISSVEKDLNTTNTNLSNLSGTVDTLNKHIQGISADFEDFKDNEYVQGIDNLQKQIDGAIQFWNGAEIPTVNNYPANEWTTENDKVNHQADIYTVVQDVEGEMKQGKSYRFDKIDGVWQWIELTDNELSAVQAIAQEALNKSNTNATDISSLKSSVSALEQTDNSIKASVETISNQIIPTSQATGSYIHIEDSVSAPLINLEIEGKSEQSGESPSPDYPSEIKSVGYENLYNEKLISENYYYNASGIKTSHSYKFINQKITDIYENMTVSFKEILGAGASNGYVRFFEFDTNDIFIKRTLINSNTIVTLQENTNYVIVSVDADESNAYFEELLITKGTKVHSYIPYGKSGIEVEVTCKNKFNINEVTWGKYNIYNNINGNFTNAFIGYEDVKSNTIYSISALSSDTFRISYQFLDVDGNVLSGDYNSVPKTSHSFKNLLSPSNATKILISQLDASSTSDIKVQLEESEKPTEIEEYKLIKTQFVLNEPLRSLPNGVKDIAYIKNNKLYVDRYVGSVILNGSENWLQAATSTSGKYRFRLDGLMSIIKKTSSDSSKASILLSHYKAVSTTDTYTNIQGSSVDTLGHLFIYDNTNASSLTNFKTWLSAHPTQVDYELAEPYNEELGEIEMPSTLKGTTNITTTDELEPTINIEYVRDTTLSSYVEGQLQNERVIREENIAELIIEENQIKESVQTVSGSVDGLKTTVSSATDTLTSQGRLLEIVSTNIDKSTGEVREVTTTTGITLNAKGMTISDDSGFKGEHTPQGTFYKDGETVTGQYTKDGSKQKDLELFGTYSYGKENINDTPMFIAQLYKDENGEECFGHFYNGGGY